MKNLDTIFNDLQNIIMQHMKPLGSMKNGYMTYVKGKVIPNTHSQLEISTPEIENMLKKDITNSGILLHEKLKKYLVDNDIKLTLVLEPEHINHGAYQTAMYFEPIRFIINLN